MEAKEKRQPQRVNASKRCNYKPCGEAFVPARVDMVFCSTECRKVYYREVYKIGAKCMEGKCPFSDKNIRGQVYPKEET